MDKTRPGVVMGTIGYMSPSRRRANWLISARTFFRSAAYFMSDDPS